MRPLSNPDSAPCADTLARRHARAMLWTVGVFCGGQIALIPWRLYDEPKWNALAMILLLPASGLIPLLCGPRYVGVLLLIDGALAYAQAYFAAYEHWVALTVTHAVFVVSMFAKGLWPLFERGAALSRGDILGPWGAALGIYLGSVLGILFGGFDHGLVFGACALIGVALMIQSCQRAWAILRGPREARPPRVGLPVRPIPDEAPAPPERPAEG